MIPSFVSTASLSETMRRTLARTQTSLVEAQKELSSGRHADIGLVLGASTARSISLRGEMDQLQSLTDTNSMLTPKLAFTQSVLGSLSDAAGTFLEAAIAARGSGQGASVARAAAEDALKSFIGAMNATYDGNYIFAGINTTQQPIADFFAVPAQANKTALDNAFLAEFGFSQTSPSVSSLTAGDIETFLSGSFDALFQPANWVGSWSSASDINIVSRVSPRETVPTSVNANADPIRQMGKALTMIADLGIEGLSGPARDTLLDNAIRVVGGAVAGVAGLRAEIGLSENRVSSASARMSIQMDIFNTGISELESVDAAEAALRVNALSTQMETAYAITARLSRLSLINYL